MSEGNRKFSRSLWPIGREIDIFDSFNKCDINTWKGLAFVHAFTGCNDTVSNFYKVVKTKFWTVWLGKVKAGNIPLSNIFEKSSNCPMIIEVDEFDTLCNFVYEAYGLTKQAPFKTRRTDDVISTPNVNLHMLVPSPSVILQHTSNEHVSMFATFGISVKLKPTYLRQLNRIGNHALAVHSYHTGKMRLS